MPNKTSTESTRTFAYSREFPNEIESVLKIYDKVFKELTSISNGTIEFSDEYGVCNNRYKFRYITPSDIATFVSNLIKVLESRVLNPNIADVEKFAVMSAKQFVENNKGVPIENSSIYGLYKYTLADMTLNDLLVLTENDFYHTTVVSRFEMEARAKGMKDDYKKIADMHFSQNMKKIVQALPGMIQQTNYNYIGTAEQKLVQTYIESFIMFVTVFNTIIMSNMILFCVPKSTYNPSLQTHKHTVPRYNSLMDCEDFDTNSDADDDGVVTEAVKLEKNIKVVYIVLMEGVAVISREIKRHTTSRFSHIGIAFEPDLHKVYSFGVGIVEHDEEGNAKKKSGFVIEDMSDKEHENIKFTTYAALVNDNSFDSMKEYVSKVKEAPKTVYSAGMIVSQLFNRDSARKNVPDARTKEVCSTFVNSVLSAAGIDVTKKNRPSPGDFEIGMMTNMRNFTRVFSGVYADYDIKDVEERIESFAKNSKTELLAKLDNEVVTECCLLKTAGIRCNSKIPFDINMRNIVLQDMHPAFKDTKSAIKFITNDTRSPIAQLIYKYCDIDDAKTFIDSNMICKMFMNDGDCCYSMCNNNSMNKHTEKLHHIDFHTDVNWLDKIAYGNNFLDGNYRNDALGDNNFHPIKNSLEMLYRMFGECEICKKEDLATHIVKISKLMIGIIDKYESGALHNWEMTRDILAVLGEIMTRSMIKLYDKHMVIIASDNMNDVDVPGYMYTESFQFVMEDGENTGNTGTTSSSDDKTPSVQQANPTVDKNANTFEKIKQWCSIMVRKFKTWIKNVFQKISEKFSKQYSAQINYVTSNDALNKEIESNENFKPAIKNWPAYKIPLTQIKDMRIYKLVEEELQKVANNPNTIVTGVEFKKKFYPQALSNLVTESYVMEAENETSQQTSDGNKQEDSPFKTALKNFFLYSNPNPSDQEKYNQTWTSEVWKDLYETLENCNKAISIGINEMKDDLDKSIDAIQKKIEGLKDTENGQNQAGSTNLADGAKARADKLQELLKTVQSISNEYCLNFAETMQKNVFETSYRLYCDTVKQYKNSNGNLNPQMQNQTQTQAQATATDANAATPATNANANTATNATNTTNATPTTPNT